MHQRNKRPGTPAGKFLLLVVLAALWIGCQGKRSSGADTSGATPASAGGELKLLNVSYDPTRELYAAVNEAFGKQWKAKSGQSVKVDQSHGGSSKQARAVIDGLEADVVTLALAYDIDSIADKSHLIAGDWQKRLPNNSAPYTSTIAFLVRKGNPKQIKDWGDLVKPGVKVITSNPKTSGAARWNYLGAWGYALKKEVGDLAKLADPAFANERAAAEAKAKAFVSALYKNVPVLDSGARGSTTTFVNRGIGDVLINWENEILLGAKEQGADQFETIIPPVSILAEPTVSIVDKNVDKHGTRAAAEAYLQFLYSDEGQELVAKNFYRPQNAAVAAKHAAAFPKLELFTLAQIAGDWRTVQKTHFDDGGVFDQIYQPSK
jgi:sulfate/thiosulfate transport system substrate-binding protein